MADFGPFLSVIQLYNTLNIEALILENDPLISRGSKGVHCRSRDKLAGPKLLVYVVERGKCYLIFQLTITITVDISVDNNNCPYTGQLLK